MYVCMYVCMYIYIHTHTYINILSTKVPCSYKQTTGFNT